MNIQIFGKRKSFATKKAARWFKERRLKYQYIDLVSKGVSPGEYRSCLLYTSPQLSSRGYSVTGSSSTKL